MGSSSSVCWRPDARTLASFSTPPSLRDRSRLEPRGRRAQCSPHPSVRRANGGGCPLERRRRLCRRRWGNRSRRVGVRARGGCRQRPSGFAPWRWVWESVGHRWRAGDPAPPLPSASTLLSTAKVRHIDPGGRLRRRRLTSPVVTSSCSRVAEGLAQSRVTVLPPNTSSCWSCLGRRGG